MSTLKVNALQDTSGKGFYPARVWIDFDGAGTVGINADQGISSVTDAGTGRYNNNFSNNAPNVNYSTAGQASNNDTVYTTGNDFATSFGRGHRSSTSMFEFLSAYAYSPAPRDGGNHISVCIHY